MVAKRRKSAAPYIIAAILLSSFLFLFIVFETNAVYDDSISGYDEMSQNLRRPTSVTEVERMVSSFGNARPIGSGSSGTLPGGSAVMPGQLESVQNAEDEIYNFLVSMGYNSYAVCGIMGNINHESGYRWDRTQGDKHNGETLDSCRTTVKGDGHGVVQWDSGRRVQLIELAESQGLQWYDKSVQMEKLRQELLSDYYGKWVSPAKLNACSSVEEACFIFAKYFEACKGADSATFETRTKLSGWSDRYRDAQIYYTRYFGNQ